MTRPMPLAHLGTFDMEGGEIREIKRGTEGL